MANLIECSGTVFTLQLATSGRVLPTSYNTPYDATISEPLARQCASLQNHAGKQKGVSSLAPIEGTHHSRKGCILGAGYGWKRIRTTSLCADPATSQ